MSAADGGATGFPRGTERAAELHLGDRLAAFVDGELGHDSRERVLAHLATCPQCRAEADEQRRVKNVLAAAAAPGPSEGLLARLQGLPAGDVSPLDAVARTGGADHRGPVPGVRTDRFEFRIHRMPSRPAPAAVAASAGRSRRLAFAAAGAFSVAAIALGGALPADGVDGTGRGEDQGNTITPLTVGTAGAVGTAGLRETQNHRPGTLSVPVRQAGLLNGPAVGLMPVSVVSPSAAPAVTPGQASATPLPTTLTAPTQSPAAPGR